MSKPTNQQTATATLKARRGSRLAGMMRQKVREEEGVTVEAMKNDWGEEIPDVLRVRINQPITMMKEHLDLVKELAQVEGYPSWESLLEALARNGIVDELQKKVSASKRLGQDYSRYLAKKYSLKIQEPGS